MIAKKIASVTVFLCLGLFMGSFGGRVLASMRPLPEVKIDAGEYAGLASDSKEPLMLISTSSCPYCKQTREYLESRGIKYQDYVTDKSPRAEQLYKEFGSPGVPVLFTADHKMLGYSPKSIDKMLAMDGIHSRYP